MIDDGSTDGSVVELQQFGKQIKFERQDNRGQAAAINHGIAISTGDIIFMLDGDDILLPDTLERVVGIWRPDLTKVHYRLFRIGSSGARTGGPPMPPYRELPSGNLSPILRKFGLYPSPPSSGNAYGRAFLQRILPLPTEAFPVAADTFLIGAAALFGRVDTLSGFGGAYRESESGASRGGVDVLIQKAKVDACYIDFIQRLADEAGIAGVIRPLWPQHLKEQIIIAKFSGSSLRALINVSLHYLWTVCRWPEYPLKIRIRMFIWALVVLMIPRRLLQPIPGIVGPVISLRQKPSLIID